MRKILIGMCLAVLAAATPVSSQAQDQQAQAEAEALAALRASLSASAHASLVAAVQDAREQGLPAQPLIAKAQEGVAKNVPGERIMIAVHGSFQRLVRARDLLRPGGAPTADEMSAVADALQRGVPDAAIASLAGNARGRSAIALSSHALADLLGHGVPMAIGIEVIGAWGERGGDASSLAEIPAAVERLVRQGIVPARAGAAVAAGLRLGRRPGSIMPPEVPGLLRRGGGG